jgi:hypothetical protein
LERGGCICDDGYEDMTFSLFVASYLWSVLVGTRGSYTEKLIDLNVFYLVLTSGFIFDFARYGSSEIGLKLAGPFVSPEASQHP